MKLTRKLAWAGACVVAALIYVSGSTVQAQARSGTPTMDSSAEVDQFLIRWKDPRNKRFLDSAFWTMLHDYDRLSRVTAVITAMQPYMLAIDKYENGDRRALARVGGLHAYKERVALWLRSPEVSVRAFAAIFLGVSGDQAYAQRVARLLKNPIKTRHDDEPIDRGRAAQALGMMGATEYREQLSAYLNSANQYDRVGAIYGFGYLKAKDQELAIGRLLYDKDESVRTAAEEALGWIDEPQSAQ